MPDERIGGSETITVMPPDGSQLRQGDTAETLTPVVLRELLATQRGLQDEAKATTNVLNTMATSLAEIKVRIEPVVSLQKDITAHENRLTKVEQQAMDNRDAADRSFKMVLSFLGIGATVTAVVLAWILSHVTWK